MNLILKNLIKVLSNKISFISFIIAVLSIGSLFYYFKNCELTIGNLGMTYFVIELILEIFITLLFGIFIGSSIYKILYFSNIKKKNLGVGGIASFFGVIVSGCPACSITLASYLGFASILSILPYHGIELKILSVILLLYVVYDLLKTLEICKIKK